MKKIGYRPTFTDEMIEAAVAVLKQGLLIRPSAEGPSQGRLFEEEFAEWCSLAHAVNLSSGTAAIHLALIAYGIGQGDEVITVPNTFNSVADCISLVGADPVFVDVCPDTANMDVTKVEAAITKKTKAIIPVHTAGHSVDMDPLMDIANRHGLIVIEDACQAVGAAYKGRMIGTTGHCGCYSFVQNKAVSCGGEGGVFATNDEEIAYTVRTLGNHGRGRRHTAGQTAEVTYGHLVHDMIGFNYRQSEVLSAIARLALKQVKPFNEKRRHNAKLYDRLLSGRNLPIVLPVEKEWAYHSYLRYEIRAENRDRLREYLAEQNVQTSVHYPTPLHLDYPYQKKYGIPEGSYPVSEEFCRKTLTIPNYPDMTANEVEYVATKIAEFYRKA